MCEHSNCTICHCGSGKLFMDCCEPIIDGSITAPSAEALMRSRYTAHVLKNEQYLLDSWHESTRPDSIDMDTSVQWIRLRILNSKNNQVEFVATYRIQGKAYKMNENSHFVFEDERWFYVAGITGSE